MQGTADLKAQFGRNRHELNCTTYQMCILLQFNRATTISYKDLKDATSIEPESELKRHLVSLCTPKNRILLKGSKGKLVTGTRRMHAIGSCASSHSAAFSSPRVAQTTIPSLLMLILSPR